jgi:sugar fermentation stimulation protein A
MRFDAPPIEGRLRERYKRFFADVELDDGSVITAHCPNTGSLLGCKEPGSRAWLRDSGDPNRKLRYTWQAVEVPGPGGGAWVNVDTNHPNRVVHEAIVAGEVPELAGYDEARREVKYGKNSRIDVHLTSADRPPCYVEVKNTTYALGNVALFPDAATERGLKHLGELRNVVKEGARAVQLFFVSRSDVEVFRPADAIDPRYATTLRRAVDDGVEVLAWSTRVERDRLELLRPLELDLEGPRRYVKPRGRKKKVSKATWPR